MTGRTLSVDAGSGLRGQLVVDDAGLEGGRAEQFEVGDVDSQVVKQLRTTGKYRKDPEVVLVDQLVLQQRLGELTRSVLGAFYDSYNKLGYGFLENVCVGALRIELEKRGHRVEREVPARP